MGQFLGSTFSQNSSVCWAALKAAEYLSSTSSPLLRCSPAYQRLCEHRSQEPGASVGRLRPVQLSASYLECCACCVTDIGQDLYRFFEHDPECVSSPVTTKSSIILSQGLFFLIFNDLWFLREETFKLNCNSLKENMKPLEVAIIDCQLPMF